VINQQAGETMKEGPPHVSVHAGGAIAGHTSCCSGKSQNVGAMQFGGGLITFDDTCSIDVQNNYEVIVHLTAIS